MCQKGGEQNGHKNEYPILEYSTDRNAVINPDRDGQGDGGFKRFPRLCLVTFFEEVLDSAVERYGGEKIGTYVSEMKDFHVYRLTVDGTEVCAVQAVVASGSIAMMTEMLYGCGVEAIVCCGGCGVLDDIPEGAVIIPVRALRDEGASYKYLPPARFIDLQPELTERFRKVLEGHGIPYIECATWSSDSSFTAGISSSGMRRTMTTGTGTRISLPESGCLLLRWRRCASYRRLMGKSRKKPVIRLTMRHRIGKVS